MEDFGMFLRDQDWVARRLSVVERIVEGTVVR
jgi:hypothetical protein